MARPMNSLIGQRFGSLTVVARAENPGSRQTKWLCRCDCGKTHIAYGLNLKAGRVTSCGCRKAGMGKEQMRQTFRSLDRLQKDALDPYQNLANAIIVVAANDYRMARSCSNQKLIAKLEEFFRSGWYKMLTNVDGDVLLGMLQRETSQEAKE